MKEKSIEVKVGALVLVCAALLVTFVVVLGDLGGASGFPIAVDYPTASDLKPGAPVKVAGVTGGKVERIEYWGGRLDPQTGRRVTVRVYLDLDPDKGQTLHQDARFYISTQGILGEKYIEVDPGSYELPLLAAGARAAGEPPLRMEILGQQLTKVSGAITRILEANEGVVGELLQHADQAVLETRAAVADARQLMGDNRQAIARTIARLDQASERAEALVAALQLGVGDGRAIRRSIAHVENVAAKVESASEPVLRDTRAITKNLRVLSESLRDKPTIEVFLGEQAQGKVLGVVDRVGATVDDVQAVTANARTGKGTVGGLLMDNELFMDLKLLLKDLKRHPWKFIWRE